VAVLAQGRHGTAAEIVVDISLIYLHISRCYVHKYIANAIHLLDIFNRLTCPTMTAKCGGLGYRSACRLLLIHSKQDRRRKRDPMRTV